MCCNLTAIAHLLCSPWSSGADVSSVPPAQSPLYGEGWDRVTRLHLSQSPICIGFQPFFLTTWKGSWLKASMTMWHYRSLFKAAPVSGRDLLYLLFCVFWARQVCYAHQVCCVFLCSLTFWEMLLLDFLLNIDRLPFWCLQQYNPRIWFV